VSVIHSGAGKHESSGAKAAKEPHRNAGIMMNNDVRPLGPERDFPVDDQLSRFGACATYASIRVRVRGCAENGNQLISLC
jgi:hypothetical protein